jgi:hypothetical protein
MRRIDYLGDPRRTTNPKKGRRAHPPWWRYCEDVIARQDTVKSELERLGRLPLSSDAATPVNVEKYATRLREEQAGILATNAEMLGRFGREEGMRRIKTSRMRYVRGGREAVSISLEFSCSPELIYMHVREYVHALAVALGFEY